ncbi:MAG TPA: peptidase inhibitor family I36 protein [Actinophytocola sp.]|jgi:hypothetical protein|nr:peptidase inhibitor family I36 protein [Actinophytocola sp.]
MRKITTVLPIVALSIIGLAGTASADVTTQSALDGVCQSGEFCLYYNSNEQGSLSDFELGVKDFATVRFVATGAGKGELVKNNAASACNKDDNLTARVFFNSNWAGAHDDIAPGTCRNLVNTYNENASFLWIAPGA